MLVVHHRINAAAGLSGIPASDGTEVDLRTDAGHIILNHEPFGGGERLDAYLDVYGADRRAPLILNVKEDLLEASAAALCRARGIDNYFFLDCAFPTLVRLAHDGFPKAAVRVSAYEPIEMARGLRGRVEWAWIDCFGGQPLDALLVREVQELGYRICLVSPEIQGRADALERHLPLRPLLRPGIDAVCTKLADRWAQR